MKFVDSLPLYYQMAKDIKGQIKKGSLKENDKLNTEKYYQDYYGISRVTVRKALSLLSEEGYITHIHNKGYFVKGGFGSSEESKVVSTHQQITKSGKKSTSDIIRMEYIKADKDLAKNLLCNVNDDIMCIRRLRKSDDKPYALQIMWLQSKMFKDFNPWLLRENSFRSIMEDQYGYNVSYNYQNIEAKMPNDEVSDLLCINKEEPILFITAQLFSTDDRVLEYSQTYFLTSEYSYIITTGQKK